MTEVEPPRDLIGRNETELLRPAEVARLFKVTRRCVGLWVEEGKIRYIRTPGGQTSASRSARSASSSSSSEAPMGDQENGTYAQENADYGEQNHPLGALGPRGVCYSTAPIMRGDTGPNHCELPMGHAGDHYCMPYEVPYPLCCTPSYGRRWSDDG